VEAPLADNSVSAEVITLFKGEPWKFTSVHHLANYFESKSEIKTTFLDPSGVNDGSMRSNVIQAWLEAVVFVNRGLKRKENDVPDEPLDDPLRVEVNEGLDNFFRKAYGFDLPASWLGPASLQGRFHREFKRGMHVLYEVRKIKTMEGCESLGPSHKRINIGPVVMDLPMASEAGTEIPVRGCHLYLYGLKIVLFTMAKAGAFMMRREGKDDIVFAPLQPLMEHLASAENLVFTFTTGDKALSDQVVLDHLVSTDQAIRKEWAKYTRDNKTMSLGECQQVLKGHEKLQWMLKPQVPAVGKG